MNMYIYDDQPNLIVYAFDSIIVFIAFYDRTLKLTCLRNGIIIIIRWSIYIGTVDYCVIYGNDGAV